MKTIKKISAWLMTLVFVTVMLGTSVSAADKKPTDADTATITVNGIESGATVTAYKIVEATYNDYGFTGYKKVEGIGTLDSITNPDSTQISTIAQTIAENKDIESVLLTETTAGSKTYQATVTAGSWLVVVTNTKGATIYNPMLLSVAYDVEGAATNNSLSDSVISATDTWRINETEAYVKSSTPSVDKTIVKDEEHTNHDDVAIGDRVQFEIASTMPSYSDQYKKVVVNINDTLSKGLSYYADEAGADDVVVEVGTTTAQRGTDYTIVKKDSQTMSIQFTSDFIKANGNKAITVTYSAVLNDEAGLNFDANTNTASMEYSNNPNTNDTGKTEDSKNYVYTFALDANLCGTDKTISGNKVTHEIIKVDESGNTTLVEQTNTVTGLKYQTTESALEGATFTLTNDVTGKVYTEVSDENGYLSFTGLDAGSYTLQETAAPAGYTLNNAKHPVVITASYDTDGLLTSYTVTIDNKATSTYTATYNKEEKEPVITEIKGDSTTTFITNTKIAELPSTGGMGTYLFTIGGVALMAAAVVMFAMSRKNRVTDK